ncbi:MAG TPA: hypothetical protein GX396_00695 [Tissierellia bacterium]|nr:hypothetical protein [Tissierellia bacterium]
MKRKHLYFIIAVLILFNFTTMNKIHNIENSMNRSLRQIQNEQIDLRNEIKNIYANVDEKLKKQISLFDSYTVTFGSDLNKDNLTIPVEISVTPKEQTENLTADLLVNDQRHVMVKNGSRFTASINAYLFDPLQIKVILKDKGLEKIETIDEYDDLQYKYLLDMYVHFAGRTKYISGKYQYEGDIIIDYFESKNNSLEKISISKYINGTFIDEQEVDMKNLESKMHTIHSLQGEVELSANDRIEIYINVLDKYGLNYKYIVLADEIDSDGKLVEMRPEWTNGSLVEIIDKSGKVLRRNIF